MYIRFESILRDEDSRWHLGIFQTAGEMLRITPAHDYTWQHAELERTCAWYNDALDAPDRFYYRPCRRAERSGVCWFRDTARPYISRAYYMAWLIEDLGVPVRQLRVTDPGAILWADEHQVVALPQAQRLQ